MDLAKSKYCDFARSMKTAIIEQADAVSRSNISKYYNLYLDNLKRTIIQGGFEYSFNKSEKYIIVDSAHDWEFNKNPFIFQSNPLALAEDITKNGTYYPIWYRRRLDGELVLSEGIHRVEGLVSAKSDIEILAIEETMPLNLSKQKIELHQFIPDSKISLITDEFCFDLGFSLGQKTMKDCYQIEVDIVSAEYNLIMMSRCITEMIFKNCKNFKASQIMTDKDKFKVWLNS